MSKVVLDLSMSLDGFIAGRNINPEQPLGENGMRLHDWMFKNKTDENDRVTEETFASSGAVLVGARTYHDAIDNGWDGVSPFQSPAFVVTKTVPDKAVDGFTYVTDGVESAVQQAKAVAGDKNVWLMGGAGLTQEVLKAGLLDEMQIHLVPLLLGKGTRLFDNIGGELVELESTRVIDSTSVTHLKYRVVK